MKKNIKLIIYQDSVLLTSIQTRISVSQKSSTRLWACISTTAYCAHIEMQIHIQGRLIKGQNLFMCFWEKGSFWKIQISCDKPAIFQNLAMYFNTYKSNNTLLYDNFQAKISVQVLASNKI